MTWLPMAHPLKFEGNVLGVCVCAGASVALYQGLRRAVDRDGSGISQTCISLEHVVSHPCADITHLNMAVMTTRYGTEVVP